MNNLRGIMKQKTFGAKPAFGTPGPGVQATPALGQSSFMNQPTPPTSLPAQTGLLKKKKVPGIQPVPNLMQRLTGK